MATVPEIPSPSAWSGFWEETAQLRIHAVEAEDHVDRVLRDVAPRPTDRVLDFGCGFGHVAALLAPHVGSVGYWDAAAQMRRATAARTAALPNVALVDLDGPVAAGGIDLLLVTSVVQYMDADELGAWLTRWRGLLAPGGRIVVSDVPVPGGSDLRELAGMLGFAARHGFLVRALRDALGEARRYSGSRARARLTRWTPAGFTALAARHGLAATRLPRNLTHRTGRFTVLLTPGPPQP